MRDLPGLMTRPLATADAEAVFATMAAQERADLGSVEIELADIVGDWQRPSFDLGASTVGVFEGDLMVGYAEVSGGTRGDAAVLPTHRGRGIGTWLARWLQDAARARGEAVIGMPVPEGSPGDRLLAALGYDVRWTSWVLEVPPGRTVPPRPVPPGHVVRSAVPDEHAAVHAVVEDAFGEWADRERQSLADFAAVTWERPGSEPWQMRVVVDPHDVVVGAALVTVHEQDAYVSHLAVRHDRRGEGLAQMLLVDAFEQARAHGALHAQLSTDSRTGALGLYEKVGMRVTSTWVNRAIALTRSS